MFAKSGFRLKILAVGATVLLSTTVGLAQEPASKNSGPLYDQIAAVDKQFFDAYNECKLDKLKALLDDQIEFYHDQGGLMIGSENVVNAVQKNICGKVTRELVPGTLEVYPIKDYGAVEIGTHRFHHPGHEQTEPVGEAKFVQLWQNKNGSWKMTRVFSIDHHALPKP